MLYGAQDNSSSLGLVHASQGLHTHALDTSIGELGWLSSAPLASFSLLCTGEQIQFVIKYNLMSVYNNAIDYDYYLC